MRTVFIIAGFNLHEDATDHKFSVLRQGLTLKGYKVVPVRISWLRKTPTQYNKEFVNFYNKHKGAYNIVLGNSFGAVITLLSAPECKPQEIFVCSLSPFFKEDKHFKPDSYFIRHFGKKRLKELRSLAFVDVAEKINGLDIKTNILYGEKENQTSPPLVKRCKNAAELIYSSSLMVLPDAPHSMSNDAYTKELLKLF
jgi:hypothetical protein